jgi:TatA/E family protein of Tat protein translocase
MFGLGVWEIALIVVVALFVLGPDKLPDAAKTLGKALNDFRRAGDDIRREVMGENLPAVKPVVPGPAQTIVNKVDPRATPPADPTPTATATEPTTELPPTPPKV